MLTLFFFELLQMSIAGGFLILVVLLLRLLFQAKAPRWVISLLWIPVALRLILPFSMQSILSLMPTLQSTTAVGGDSSVTVRYGYAPIIPVPPTVESFISPSTSASGGVTPPPSHMEFLREAAAVLWLVGVAVLLTYALVSYLRLRRRVATAVRMELEPESRLSRWQSEAVTTPFILGLLRPRVYLPYRLDEDAMTYVMAHETAHIRRLDHVTKPIAYCVLALHWFNPLVWVAFSLLCRDMETAADERVVKGLDTAARQEYARVLLSFADTRGARVAACPTAFGEVGVKGRIRAVLSYKKPYLWAAVAVLLALVLLAVCFLTDPIRREESVPYGWYGISHVSETACEYGDFHMTITDFFLKPVTVETENGTTDSVRTVLRVRLDNCSDQAIGFGEVFHIYRREGNDWVSAANGDVFFHLPLYLLEPHTSTIKDYDLQGFDLSEPGRYKFEISIQAPINEYGAKRAFQASFTFDTEGSSALTTPCPEDFAIRFTAQTGKYPQILDTFDGYLQKDLVQKFPYRARADYEPSPAERQYLWYLVESCGITEMPADLHPVSLNGIQVEAMPNTEYTVTVRANGKTYTVTANSATFLLEDEAAKSFWRFHDQLHEFIYQCDEWKRLPTSQGGYD